jgi:hypothetical protein
VWWQDLFEIQNAHARYVADCISRSMMRDDHKQLRDIINQVRKGG